MCDIFISRYSKITYCLVYLAYIIYIIVKHKQGHQISLAFIDKTSPPMPSVCPQLEQRRPQAGERVHRQHRVPVGRPDGGLWPEVPVPLAHPQAAVPPSGPVSTPASRHGGRAPPSDWRQTWRQGPPSDWRQTWRQGPPSDRRQTWRQGLFSDKRQTWKQGPSSDRRQTWRQGPPSDRLQCSGTQDVLESFCP